MKHWSRDFEIAHGNEFGEHDGKDIVSGGFIPLLVQRQESLGRFLWMLSDLSIKDHSETIELFLDKLHLRLCRFPVSIKGKMSMSLHAHRRMTDGWGCGCCQRVVS